MRDDTSHIDSNVAESHRMISSRESSPHSKQHINAKTISHFNSEFINSSDQTKRAFDFSLSCWISILISFSGIANSIFPDRPFCIASINESFRFFQQNQRSEG